MLVCCHSFFVCVCVKKRKSLIERAAEFQMKCQKRPTTTAKTHVKLNLFWLAIRNNKKKIGLNLNFDYIIIIITLSFSLSCVSHDMVCNAPRWWNTEMTLTLTNKSHEFNEPPSVTTVNNVLFIDKVAVFIFNPKMVYIITKIFSLIAKENEEEIPPWICVQISEIVWPIFFFISL